MDLEVVIYSRDAAYYMYFRSVCVFILCLVCYMLSTTTNRGAILDSENQNLQSARLALLGGKGDAAFKMLEFLIPLGIIHSLLLEPLVLRFCVHVCVIM